MVFDRNICFLKLLKYAENSHNILFKFYKVTKFSKQ